MKKTQARQQIAQVKQDLSAAMREIVEAQRARQGRGKSGAPICVFCGQELVQARLIFDLRFPMTNGQVIENKTSWGAWLCDCIPFQMDSHIRERVRLFRESGSRKILPLLIESPNKHNTLPGLEFKKGEVGFVTKRRNEHAI
jgi:hypothetical protein